MRVIRVGIVLLAVACSLFSACGSSSSSGTTTTASSTTTTTTPAPVKPAEPKGRLSAGEYSVQLQLAKAAKRLDRIKSPTKLVRGIRRLCGGLADAPPTQLMQADSRACARAVRFYASLAAFRTERAACARASKAGDASCYGELFSRMARATHSSLASAREVNAALRRRALRGRCADGIGATSEPDLKTAAALGRDARRASQLLYAHYNLDAYVAAVHAVEADLTELGKGPKTDEVKAIRSCRRAER